MFQFSWLSTQKALSEQESNTVVLSYTLMASYLRPSSVSYLVHLRGEHQN